MATKREMEQRARYYSALQSLGFTYDECEQLRRISMTLRRWHELECGTDRGSIERDETTGRPYWHAYDARGNVLKPYPMADRERGAKKRLARIIAECNRLRAGVNRVNGDDAEKPVSAYVQTDPRGAALYILRLGDVPEGQSADAYYSRGICVF